MVDKILLFLQYIGVGILSQVVSLGHKVIDYMSLKQKTEIMLEEKKEKEKKDKKIEDVCNKGLLDDLLVM